MVKLRYSAPDKFFLPKPDPRHWINFQVIMYN